MSRLATEADLSNYFDADLIWRRKELSDMKSAIRSSDQASKAVLLRALIALSYAHWEGYVKECATRYFQHISLRRKPFNELERQFYLNSFLVRLDALFQSRTSIESRCKLIGDILDGQSRRFAYVNKDLIDTKSNLSSDVVKDICILCGVDGALFEDRKIFIDKLLLKRRNAIAHGQQEYLNEADVDDLVADTLAIMGHFRTLLENKVYTKSYLAA